jgi:hypothetical protein
VDVTASTISGGPEPFNESDVFKHIEMMGEKVRTHIEFAPQFGRGAIAAPKRLDDGEPHGVTESGVSGGPEFKGDRVGHTGPCHGTRVQSMIIE